VFFSLRAFFQTRIVISPAVQHKLEQYWENPEKFDPDRWNKENEHNQYGFIPFLVGPRQCIGIKFAMLEMRIVLATLLRRFSVTLVPGCEVKPKLFITCKPFPYLKCELHPRQHI